MKGVHSKQVDQITAKQKGLYFWDWLFWVSSQNIELWLSLLVALLILKPKCIEVVALKTIFQKMRIQSCFELVLRDWVMAIPKFTFAS